MQAESINRSTVHLQPMEQFMYWLSSVLKPNVISAKLEPYLALKPQKWLPLFVNRSKYGELVNQSNRVQTKLSALFPPNVCISIPVVGYHNVNADVLSKVGNHSGLRRRERTHYAQTSSSWQYLRLRWYLYIFYFAHNQSRGYEYSFRWVRLRLALNTYIPCWRALTPHKIYS